MPLLEVRNLTKVFRSRSTRADGVGRSPHPAVDSVSLTVDPAETLGLVGESGCGKTTLSRCILQLETATSGEVVFEGLNLGEASPAALRQVRRRMQIVFQDPFGSLDPRWTIGSTIAEPLKVHGTVARNLRGAEVERLLREVGLPPSAAQRYPHEFSGGQRQRIGIARALALRPSLLIADEPVSALDVSVRAQVLNLLRTAQRRYGLGMLFIAHDLAAVRQVSRRIAVMYLGKVLEQGPTAQIFENPRHPYTRSLLDAIPSIGRRGAPSSHSDGSDGKVDEKGNFSRGCRFRSRCLFAKPICAESEPPAISVSPDHVSLCHFAADLPEYDRFRTSGRDPSPTRVQDQ